MPWTFNNPATGIRYLILENLNLNSPAWQNADTTVTPAVANDIIQWTGTAWEVIFNSSATTNLTYITNSYTGIQYKWDQGSWSKSFEGVYNNWSWRLVL